MSRKPRQSRTKSATPAKPPVPAIAANVDNPPVVEADAEGVEHATGQPLEPAMEQPIGQSVGQSVGQSTGPSIEQADLQDGERAPEATIEPAGQLDELPRYEREDQTVTVPVAAPFLPPAPQPAVQYEPDASDIRGVLIQLAGARLLLPNANIAEVLSYAPPEPVEAAPEWLLGKMRWRGWQLPLVAFAELAGIGKEPAGLGSKVVVLKALAGDAKAPYFAILTQGFPRLVTVSQQGLQSEAESADLPRGVQARVRLNEDTALVPDLEVVEGMINDALAQAA